MPGEKKIRICFCLVTEHKTFISLYLALEQVLDPKTKYENVIIIRSVVPTRDMGFLPGDEEDKSALYQVPYHNMVQFMFEQSSDNAFSMLYDRLKNQGSITFDNFISSWYNIR